MAPRSAPTLAQTDPLVADDGGEDRTESPDISSRAARIRLRSLPAVLVLVVAVGVWQLAVDGGLLSRAAVASPSDTLRAAPHLLGAGEFWSALAATVLTWVAGWLVALIIAVPAGIALGSSSSAYRLTRFSIDFLRTIPPVALLPLALLLYGATNRMAIELIVFGSVWPVLLQSMYGVHQIDAVARDVVRSYRLRRWDRVFRFIVPSAAPFIATGARLAATMSLLLAIGTEVIGGAPGLGSQINVAQQTGAIPDMFVYVVVCALLGVGSNLVLTAVERRALKWHSSYRPAQR